jgi:hypothetical protein
MMTFIVVFDSSTDEVLFLCVIYHLLAGSFPRIIDVSMRGYTGYICRERGWSGGICHLESYAKSKIRLHIISW